MTEGYKYRERERERERERKREKPREWEIVTEVQMAEIYIQKEIKRRLLYTDKETMEEKEQKILIF